MKTAMKRMSHAPVRISRRVPSELLKRGFKRGVKGKKEFFYKMSLSVDVQLIMWKHDWSPVILQFANPGRYDNIVGITQSPEIDGLLPLIDRLIAAFKP